MPEQFENPEATKLGDETESETSAEKRIDRVAEKAATKAANTEKEYDGERPIFTI
jgi:hypothetical protein